MDSARTEIVQEKRWGGKKWIISSKGDFWGEKRQFLTIVVSVTEPKLLMKILQVTFTGGPEDKNTVDWSYLGSVT